MSELRLFDEPGDKVAQIVTDGATFKPFLNAVERVVDEAKLQLTGDGLSVTAVDPANVLMGDVELSAAAFDEYTLASETTVGVYIPALKKLIRRARVNSDDELTLTFNEHEVTATVRRGYENHNVVSQGTDGLIDPDAIRQEPDLPELEWQAEVTVDRSPLVDAMSYAVGVSDYVQVSVKGVNQHTNALYLGGETDTREEAAAIDNIDADAKTSAMFSTGYVESILGGLGDVEVDEMQLKLSDEFPIVVDASGDEPLSAKYLLAPRIEP